MNKLQISHRGETTPSSPLRKLIPFAEQAKKRGTNVFHLNIGQPDILSPQKAIAYLKNMDIPVIAYTHSAGNLSLRQALAQYYNKLSVDVTEKDILITTGGSEALLNIFSCMMDIDDEVIISEPYYTNYNFFTHIFGVKIVPIHSSIKNNFALPSIDEFEKLITPKTKAILITNPGNPTGTLYTNEELECLTKIVQKYNLYLIADEVYREFCYDGLTHKSILSLTSIEENAVVIDSFSKRYSLCGIRVGAIITKNKLLLSTCLKFSQGRIAPPTLGQIIAEQSLLTTDISYLTDMKKEYEKRRNAIVKKIKEIPDVSICFPNGAFYFIAELPINDADIFCQWMLEKFSYQGNTTMMAPASGFYSNPKLGKKQVRIAYILKEQDLILSMECLKMGLKAYQ